MKPVSKAAQVVLEKLTAGLKVGDNRKVDNGGSGIMAVCVERLAARTFSVAHYFTQNGDLMADPDVVFWRGPDDKFYPTEITQAAFGKYERLVEFEGDKPVKLMKRAQAETASFCTEWMKNITWQQKLNEVEL